MRLRRRMILVAGLVVALVAGLAGTASASHFRASAGSLVYDSTAHTLTWTVDGAWAKGSGSYASFLTAGGTTVSMGGASTTATVTNPVHTSDTSTNPLYDTTRDVVTIDVSSTLSTPGTYQAYSASCCRVGGVQNTTSFGNFSQSVAWTVNPDQSIDMPPMFDNPVLYAIIPVNTGSAFTLNYHATDPGQGPVTYAQMTTDGSPDWGASALPCSTFDNGTGILTIDPSLCTGSDNFSTAYQPGYYYAVKVRASDAAGDHSETDTLLRVPTVPQPTLTAPTLLRGTAAFTVGLADTDTVVASYTVTCTNANDSSDVKTVTSGNSSLNVQGLAPNATYSCIATATNGVGSGTSSAETVTTGNFTSQTITFPALNDISLARHTLTLAATASSGLAVSYSTTTDDVCTISGSTVQLLTEGTCIVFADQAGNGTYDTAPQVRHSFSILPPAPAPTAVTSTGSGTDPQTATLPVPSGGSATLLDGSGNPATTVTVAGQGTYVYDPASHLLTFTPVPGFVGVPTPVTFRLTDLYGQSGTSTFTPSVAKPAAPPATPVQTTGGSGQPQQTQVTVPTGGSVTLVGAGGKNTNAITVKGQGTYTLDPQTGVITFKPVSGFSGKAASVTFVVKDAYGQSTTATYAATVKATSKPVKVGTPKLTVPALSRNASSIKATCALSTGKLTSCAVRLYATVNGKRVYVGIGHTTLHGAAAKAGRSSLTVTAALTKLGKTLAARPGGVTLSAVTSANQVSVSAAHYATKTGIRVVAPQVKLRPIYFSFDSAKVSGIDEKYLLGVRAQISSAAVLKCDGYADYAGVAAHEKALSVNRAKAVCAILRGGAKHARVTATGFGGASPKATGGTVASRVANRRTDVTIKF